MVQRRENVRQGFQNAARAASSTLQSERVTHTREQMRQGLQNVGSKLQKLNVGKLINQMEQDQQLADQLESLNEHIRGEKERQDVQRESAAACLQVIENSLEEFLTKEPDSTYEQWIEYLHPENIFEGQLLPGMSKEVDLRFYIEESDHRRIWNQRVTTPLRQVAARTRMWSDNQAPIDLLSASITDFEPTGVTQSNTNTSVLTTMATSVPERTSSDVPEGDLIQF